MKKIYFLIFIIFSHNVLVALELIQPNGGERIPARSDYLIKWTGCEADEEIKIEYSINEGLEWKLITDNASNYEFLWENVPEELSKNCKIRISYSFLDYEQFSQPEIEWEKNYGGSSTDVCYDAIKTKNGNYILAGITNSDDYDIKTIKGASDAWLLKIDENGNIIWSKTYGGSLSETARSIYETSDGNYVVTGYSSSSDGVVEKNYGSTDMWIYFVRNDGTLFDSKVIGGRSADDAQSVIQAKDGCYYIAGITQSNDYDFPNSHGYADYGLVKLSSNKNLLYTKQYGGSGLDHALSIVETYNGDFIIAGRSHSNDGDISKENDQFGSIWIARINSSGNIIWDKNYGGSNMDNLLSIIRSSDNNYYLLGSSNSNDGDITNNNGGLDAWLVKIDDDGNIIWQKSVGCSTTDNFYSAANTADGGVICIGNTSKADHDVSEFFGIYDIWVVKFDKDGNLLWEKSLGGSKLEFPAQIIQADDMGYMVFGHTSSDDIHVSNNYGIHDAWVVKLSPDYKVIYDDDISESNFEISKALPEIAYTINGFKDILCELSSISELRIDNNGPNDIIIDSAYFSGLDAKDFSLEFPVKNELIPDSYHLIVNVIFRPSSPGKKFATLNIENNSFNEPLIQINITGEKDSTGIKYSTDEVIFDGLSAGESQTQYVTIYNTGTIDFDFDIPVILNEFEIKNITQNPIPPGDSATAEVFFKGADEGTYRESYSVKDICNKRLTLELLANVNTTVPAIYYQFSQFNNLLCEYSEIKQITIHNQGEGELEIFGATIGGANQEDFIINNPFETVFVKEGEDFIVEVKFLPKTLGEKNAYIIIENSSSNMPELRIDFNCRKDSTSIWVSPDSLIFPDLDEFETASGILEIKNTGNIGYGIELPVTIGRFEITSVSPNPVPPDETAIAEITFTGAEAGEYKEMMYFFDYCLNKSIIGLFAEVLLPKSHIEFNVRNNFDNLLCESVGDISIELDNQGPAILQIRDIYISGPDSDEFRLNGNYKDIMLENNEFIDIDVSFIPNGAGIKNAVLNIENSSENKPELKINLNAGKDSSALEFSDYFINFDEVIINETSSKMITIKNTGTVDIHLPDNISVNHFSINNIVPNPIIAGETATAEIHFFSLDTGFYEESYIFYDLCDREYEIFLNANAKDKNELQISMKVGDAAGSPGDIVEIPIYISEIRNLEGVSIHSISGDLFFNPELLSPVNMPYTTINDNTAYVELVNMPFIKEEYSIIEIIDFIARPSENSLCELSLNNISNSGDDINIHSENGIFRLLDFEGKSGIILIDANPNKDIVEIEYNISEAGYVELLIANNLGQIIEILYNGEINYPGKYYHTINTKNYSSGVYFVILKARGKYQSEKFMLLE